MKQKLLWFALLASSFTFGQLYTSGGVVNLSTTPSSNNVGIGTYAPNSTLEVANANGAKLSISTNGGSATSANPIYPTLEFAGYANSPKARIYSTEESGNTSGSKFGIAVNDGANSTSMVERLTILANGNVGIGANNPESKLSVNYNGGAGSNQFLLSTAHVRNEDRYFMKNIIRGTGSDDITFSLRHDGQMFVDGNVGIGNNNPQFKLDVIGKSSFSDNMKVNAKIEAKEVKVTLTPTADFVFEENYQLLKLEEVEKHIKEKKHLPEIASAKQMEKEGVNVGEFQIKLLQKIEELTLYSIQQNKEIKKLQEENKTLKFQSKEIKELKKQVQLLISNKR